MKLKSDRFGMEIQTIHYNLPQNQHHQLKSDRFGMEIFILSPDFFLFVVLKSDRFGMEIEMVQKMLQMLLFS